MTGRRQDHTSRAFQFSCTPVLCGLVTSFHHDGTPNYLHHFIMMVPLISLTSTLTWYEEHTQSATCHYRCVYTHTHTHTHRPLCTWANTLSHIHTVKHTHCHTYTLSACCGSGWCVDSHFPVLNRLLWPVTLSWAPSLTEGRHLSILRLIRLSWGEWESEGGREGRREGGEEGERFIMIPECESQAMMEDDSNYL